MPFMHDAAITVTTESGFELQEAAENLTLTLWGELGLGWLGRLANALSRRGIGIETVSALCRSDGSWFGTLELSPRHATTAPAELDYVALCHEGERHSVVSNSPRLERFQLERTATGGLELRLRAKDEVGFLASVLDRCEFLGLFPERLAVKTQGGVIDDTLWLRGVAGNAASPEAERELRAQFQRFLEGA